jgi:hypothetical protein
MYKYFRLSIPHSSQLDAMNMPIGTLFMPSILARPSMPWLGSLDFSPLLQIWV